MRAEIKNCPPNWQHYVGDVVKQDGDFVVVHIKDRYYSNLEYNVRFPKGMVRVFLPN